MLQNIGELRLKPKVTTFQKPGPAITSIYCKMQCSARHTIYTTIYIHNHLQQYSNHTNRKTIPFSHTGLHYRTKRFNKTKSSMCRTKNRNTE